MREVLGFAAEILGTMLDPVLWLAIPFAWFSRGYKNALLRGCIVGILNCLVVVLLSQKYHRINYAELFFIKVIGGIILASLGYSASLLRKKQHGENRRISSLAAFISKIASDIDPDDISEDQFIQAREAADIIEKNVPDNGILSIQGRMNAFISVCRNLDDLVDEGMIDIFESHLVLCLLRLENKKFLKAAVMFDLRAPRFDIRQRAELPRVAREYLAGLEAAPSN